MEQIRRPQPLLVSLASLALFAGLAENVLALEWMALDQRIWDQFSRSPRPAAWFVSLAGAWLGYLFTLGGLIWLRARGRQADLWGFSLVALGAALLSTLMKWAYQIPRPLLDGVPAAEGYSFPSGHTLFSACVYGYLGARLWSQDRAASLLAFTLPLLVAWSRLNLGVHWFSDVVAGLLAGTFWVGLCLYVRQRFEDHGGLVRTRRAGLPQA